jgi:hypothetical protein
MSIEMSREERITAAAIILRDAAEEIAAQNADASEQMLAVAS